MSTSQSSETDSNSNSSSLPQASPPFDESESSNEQMIDGQPNFRSHTYRKDPTLAASFTAIYDPGRGVYIKGARALKGPYYVNKVNSDGTYQLRDEAWRVVKDGVKERDLQPF
ncbi:MAG: hypothetical protein Q9160_003014 [Pyrenula sp. 1 TL-2023]